MSITVVNPFTTELEILSRIEISTIPFTAARKVTFPVNVDPVIWFTFISTVADADPELIVTCGWLVD